MELLADPVIGGIITGTLKLVLVIGIIGVLVVLGVFALLRR